MTGNSNDGELGLVGEASDEWLRFEDVAPWTWRTRPSSSVIMSNDRGRQSPDVVTDGGCHALMLASVWTVLIVSLGVRAELQEMATTRELVGGGADNAGDGV